MNELEYTPVFTTEIKTVPKTEVWKIIFVNLPEISLN